MEKECRISYNDIDDTFAMSCKEENENIRGNFEIDNFIFSLTGKGKIVGIQIKEFSQILKENSIEDLDIEKITQGFLSTLVKENCILIGIRLIGEKEAKIPIRVFMPRGVFMPQKAIQ